MVIQVIQVTRLIFLLLLPAFIYSAEFNATVSQNQVRQGEGFTLNLTLKDASPRGTPSIEALKKSFSISSQQQLYNTFVMNGKMSSSTSWVYTLIPLKEGETVIPSISINTSEGTLSSEWITIQVLKATPTTDPETNDLVLTADVSNAQPYKNEPINYTVKIISKKNLADIKMQKISLENAIVESSGEPKIYQKIVDGMSVGIIEFNYLITPLKPGKLTIPSLMIEGAMPIKRKIPNAFDNFEPFSMLQRYDRLKPFALTTEEVVLDVQPAEAVVTPWLPAKSLKIEEIWDASQHFQEGQPFTRSFKITAEGIRSSQLPSLADLQLQDTAFKIYADKPELKDHVEGSSIISYRTEQYTLIPQQSGSLILPEFSVTWWDVVKKEKAIVHIPARRLDILPSPETVVRQEAVVVSDPIQGVSPVETVIIKREPILYVIIGGLLSLLLGVSFCALFLLRKIAKSQDNREEPKKKQLRSQPKQNTKEKLPDLNPT